MFQLERFRPCPNTWQLGLSPVIFQCSYDSSDFRDSGFLTHNVRRPESLRRARRKRQAEYLAGRYAAKRVLEKLGLPAEQVCSDDDGVPVWPSRVRGSISHTRSEVICAALESGGAARNIGIDIERRLSSKRMASVRELVAMRDERGLISSCSFSESWALTLLFSAKESLFKAIYPLTRTGFGFGAAEITTIDTRRKTFTAKLRQSISDQFPRGWTVRGHYLTDAGHVITLVII